MAQEWEEKFRIWAKPPSQAEIDRCEHTESEIREAIRSSDALRERNIRVFTHGSYRNNTNVRRESDIDVGVLCFDAFYAEYPEGKGDADFGNEPAAYQYAEFKKDVGAALVAYFGANVVTRGNKAFDIKAIARQVEADVAPFFEHRRYLDDGRYLSGVELRPDNGMPFKIVNWPEQHYENGVKKNEDTSRRYKAMVRVLKSLRNEMDDAGVAEARPVIGFLNECMTWNVPNEQFGNALYSDDLRNALVYLYNGTKTDATCTDWGEVSELKYLFRGGQKWTREQANAFIVAAWNHVAFQ